MQSRVRWALNRDLWIKSLVFVALYYGAARVGQVLSFGTEAAISPVWPPAGVALAGMLILGPRAWPLIVVADSVGTFALEEAAPHVVVTLLSAVVKGLVYALAAYALQRRLRFQPALERQSDVLVLVVLAAPITSALTATLGVVALWISGDLGSIDFAEFRWFWWLWWIGDVVGVIVVTPLFLTWMARSGPRGFRKRWTEATMLTLALLLVTVLVFSGTIVAAYAVFPLLIWAAMRFGPRGASLSVFVVASIGIACTTHGLGPFVFPSVLDSLAALETFTSIVAITALILAATIAERRVANESMQFQARLLEVVNQAVVATTLDGRVTYWNTFAERLYGWSAEEAVGRELDELIKPEGVAQAGGQVSNTLSRGESWTGELLVRNKDGHAFPSLVNSSPMSDGDGNLTGIVTVATDLTESKQAERALRDSEHRLRQAQKMEAIGLLAGGVAHDFNNILTAITGFSELILAKLPPKSPARSLAKQITDAADRAAGLTRQLLIFSRQQVLQPTALNLNGTVADVERLLERIIGEDIELVMELDSALGYVEVDRTQIEQVLMNLAVNARDAMPGGGRLTISTRNATLTEQVDGRELGAAPGQYVVVAVRDTGHGMDRETRTRIFEPFFTTKERGRGTGLGLATVFGIVQESHGDISVESEVGSGTTVAVYFPRVERSRVAIPAVKPSSAPSGSETILLVEDEDRVRTIACELLRMAGYTVIPAAGGEEALKLVGAGSCSIDLVLTDVVMPGMSGFETAERITGTHPDVKVMFMSGFPGDIAAADRERLGSAVFLAKPFTSFALTSGVRAALDSVKA